MGLRAPKRLELLGRNDQHAAQVPRAVGIAAFQADVPLLLVGKGRWVAERVAAVLAGGVRLVASPVAGEAQEGADRLGALGELLEEGASFGLAGLLDPRGVIAFAPSEQPRPLASVAPQTRPRPSGAR